MTVWYMEQVYDNKHLMTRTSPLLQGHTEYNATGMDICNSIQLTKLVKLGPHTADLTSPYVCSATTMPNIKHPYQLHLYEMSWDCPESNQLHFIIV